MIKISILLILMTASLFAADGDNLLVDEDSYTFDEDVLLPEEESSDNDLLIHSKEMTKKKHEKNVTGSLLEKGKRKKILNAYLFLKDREREIELDEDGKFDIYLAPGRYHFVAMAAGFGTVNRIVHVNKDEKLIIDFRLLSVEADRYRIVVRGKRSKSEVFVQRVSTEETEFIPGASGDPIKAIATMPGINAIYYALGFGTGLIIRGSSPDDSKIIAGMYKLPYLYHFGGIETTVTPYAYGSLDILNGGFSAEYNESTSGIIKLNVRKPRDDRVGGYVDLSLLSTSLLVEGPISDDETFFISIKRGMMDLYLRTAIAIGGADEEDVDNSITTYPSYYDLTAVYTKQFSKKSKLKLITFNALDIFGLKAGDDRYDDFGEKESGVLDIDILFSQFIAEWEFRKGKLKSTLSPMVGIDYILFDSEFSTKYRDESETEEEIIKLHMKNYKAALSHKLEFRLSKSQKLLLGYNLPIERYGVNLKIEGYEDDGEDDYDDDDKNLDTTYKNKKGYFFRPSLYFMDQLSFGRFTMTPGFNALWDQYNKTYYFDPRITANFKYSTKLSFNGATGIYSKAASKPRSIDFFGDRGRLLPEHAFQTVFGSNYKLRDDITLKGSVYYKHLFDLLMINRNNEYENRMTGYVYGGELMLKKEFTDKLFGWINYNYSISKRKMGPECKMRSYEMDIPHNINIIASYRSSHEWRFSMKFNYQSGTYEPDLTHGILQDFEDLTDDDRVEDCDKCMARTDGYHQLDIRIDRYWIFDNWILNAYLDVQNLYLNQRMLNRSCDGDVDSMGRIPYVYLGLKAEY